VTGIESSRIHSFSVFMKAGYLRKKSFFTRFFAHKTAEKRGKNIIIKKANSVLQ